MPSLGSWMKRLFLFLLVPHSHSTLEKESSPHMCSKSLVMSYSLNGERCIFFLLWQTKALCWKEQVTEKSFCDSDQCPSHPQVCLWKWAHVPCFRESHHHPVASFYPSRHVPTLQPPWVFSEHHDGLLYTDRGMGYTTHWWLSVTCSSLPFALLEVFNPTWTRGLWIFLLCLSKSGCHSFPRYSLTLLHLLLLVRETVQVWSPNSKSFCTPRVMARELCFHSIHAWTPGKS